MLTLAGVNDENLVELARQTGAKIALRGETLAISGNAESVARAIPIAQRMIDTAKQQMPMTADDVLRMSIEGPREGNGNGVDSETRIVLPGIRKIIQAKTSGQAEYMKLMAENDIVVGIGPAGTGKTYLAVAAAVDALARKRVRRIVLARPAVEAGESLGFLPGDMQQKVDPYLRPLYDALHDMLPAEQIANRMESGEIEIAPLAFMRGRTLNDAFIILDEAQNTTPEQMKMFLTRLGFGSKVVVTGDITQIDLPREQASGLIQVQDILGSIEGIAFIRFGHEDVVRHKLVQRIVEAYKLHAEETGTQRSR